MELGRVDEACDDLPHVVGAVHVDGHGAGELARVDGGLGRLDHLPRRLVRPRQGRDDVAQQLHRVGVVVGEMVGDARAFGVQSAAAELLGGDVLADGGLHQRRAPRKIVPCSRTITVSSHIAGT